ncbi:MAG: hypothetical protein HOW73_43410 [Polyangiaceae bacterium]|nr:hypothetical protein [Polyangiaceae bacterium]
MQPFWALVELMGHRQRAGRVSTIHEFGVELMQIEVPQRDGSFRVEAYRGEMLYGYTKCTEEMARSAACPREYSQLTTGGPVVRDVEEEEDEPWDGDGDHSGFVVAEPVEVAAPARHDEDSFF